MTDQLPAAKAAGRARLDWVTNAVGSLRLAVGTSAVAALALALVLVAPAAANFTRVAVTICSVALIVMLSSRGGAGWLAVTAPATILFNPVWPIYQSRSSWIPLDVAFLGLFIGVAVWSSRRGAALAKERDSLAASLEP